MQKKKPYLLLDAGGTLVFPDQEFLIAAAFACGILLTHEQLRKAYYQIIYELDRRARRHPPFPEDPWPQGYAHKVSTTLGLPDRVAAKLARKWQRSHKKRNLWTFTFDEIPNALICLRSAGYRMSVLSNSDGRTREVFTDLGLFSLFDGIFDSEEMGVKKPHKQAFQKILRDLNLRAREVIYIGDIYTVDFWGARAAGLGAIHLDPLQRCSDWPGVHLPGVRALPAWLESYAAQPDAHPVFESTGIRHPERAVRVPASKPNPYPLAKLRRGPHTYESELQSSAFVCRNRQRQTA